MQNTDKSTVERSRFEAWVSSPPFERSVERNPNDERVTAWPGQYRDIAVELAWLAWCESRTNILTSAEESSIAER